MMRCYCIALLSVLVTSCDLFDKEEPIPAFIAVEEVSLSTDLTTEGAATSAISDVFVSVDGQFVGVFDLPAEIPVLDAGSAVVNISAGINSNGLASDRRRYPFYQPLVKTLILVPGAVTPADTSGVITFDYFSGINFHIEDFENLGSILVPNAANTAPYEIVTAPAENVRSGEGSLEVTLSNANPTFSARTSFGLQNLPLGNSVYLEIDFKGSENMLIYLALNGNPDSRVFALGLVPQQEWTKVYVDLTDEIAAQLLVNDFELVFESTLPAGSSTGHLYLDNIKVIYP